jgi:hypothetical protein
MDQCKFDTNIKVNFPMFKFRSFGFMTHCRWILRFWFTLLPPFNTLKLKSTGSHFKVDNNRLYGVTAPKSSN